jgi:hypothetical protein
VAFAAAECRSKAKTAAVRVLYAALFKNAVARTNNRTFYRHHIEEVVFVGSATTWSVLVRYVISLRLIMRSGNVSLGRPITFARVWKGD